MTSQVGMSFACGMCGKCFKTAAECVNHIQTHTSHRPFRCLVCWPMFTDVTDSQQTGDVTQPAIGIQLAGHDDSILVERHADQHDAKGSPGVLAVRADMSHAGVAGSLGVDIMPASHLSPQQEKLGQQLEPESPATGQPDGLQVVKTQSVEGEQEQSAATQSPKNEEAHAVCLDSEHMQDTETMTLTRVAQPDSLVDTATQAQTGTVLEGDSGLKTGSHRETPRSKRRKRGVRRQMKSRTVSHTEKEHADREDDSSMAQSASEVDVLANTCELKQQASDGGVGELANHGDPPQNPYYESVEEQVVGDVPEQAGAGPQGQMGDGNMLADGHPDLGKETDDPGTEKQKLMYYLTVSAEGVDAEESESSLVPPADLAASHKTGQNKRPSECSDDDDNVHFDGTVSYLQSSLSADGGDEDGWVSLAAEAGNVDENQAETSADKKQVIQVETKSKGPNFTNVIQFLKSVSLGAASPTTPLQSFEHGAANTRDAVTESGSSALAKTTIDDAESATSVATGRRTIHIIRRQGDAQTSARVQSGDRVVVRKAHGPAGTKGKPLWTYEQSQRSSPMTSTADTGQRVQTVSGSPAQAATIKIIASSGRAGQSGSGKQTATVRIIASPSKAGQIAASSTRAEAEKSPVLEYLCVPAFTLSPQQDKTLYKPIRRTEGATPVPFMPENSNVEADSEDKAAACSKDSADPLADSTDNTTASTAVLSVESACVAKKVSVSNPSGVRGAITVSKEGTNPNSHTHSADASQSSSPGHSDITEGRSKNTEGQPSTVTEAGDGSIMWELETVREVGEHQQGTHEPSLSLEDLANVCAWIQRVNTEQGAEGWQTEIVGQFAPYTGEGQSGGMLWTAGDHDYAVLTHSTQTASATQDSEAMEDNSALQAETESPSAALGTTALQTDTLASHTEIPNAPASQMNTPGSLPAKQESQDLQMSASRRHSRQASAQSEGDPEKELMLSCVDLYRKRKLPKQGTAPATPAARTRSQMKMGQAGVATGEDKAKQRGRKRTRLRSPDHGQTAHSIADVDTMPESVQDVGGAGLPVTSFSSVGLVSQGVGSRVNCDVPVAPVSDDVLVMWPLSVVLTDVHRDHDTVDSSQRNVRANSDPPSATCSSQDGFSAPTLVGSSVTSVVPHCPSVPGVLTVTTTSTSPEQGSEPVDAQSLTAQPAVPAPVTRYPRRGETRATHSLAQIKHGVAVQSIDSSPVQSITGSSQSPTSGQDKQVMQMSTRSRDKGTTPKQDDSKGATWSPAQRPDHSIDREATRSPARRPDHSIDREATRSPARRPDHSIDREATRSPARRHDGAALQRQATVETFVGIAAQSPSDANDMEHGAAARRETRNTPKNTQRVSVHPSQQDGNKQMWSQTAVSGDRQRSSFTGTDMALPDTGRDDTENGRSADSRHGVEGDTSGYNVDGHVNDIAETEECLVPSTRSKTVTPSSRLQSKMPGSSTMWRQSGDESVLCLDVVLEPQVASSTAAQHGAPARKSLDRRRLSGARARRALQVAKSVRARGQRYSQLSSPVKRRWTEGSGEEVLSESVYIAKGRLRASTLFSHPQYYGKRAPELHTPLEGMDREPTSDDDSSAPVAGTVTKVQSGCTTQAACAIAKTEVQSPAHQMTPPDHTPSDSPDKLTVRLPFMPRSFGRTGRHDKSTRAVRKVTDGSRVKQLHHSFLSSTGSSENRPSLRERSATKTSPEQSRSAVDSSRVCDVQSNSVRQAVQDATVGVLSEIGQTNEVAVASADSDQSLVYRSKQAPLQESAADNSVVEGDEGLVHKCDKCGAKFSHKLTLLSHMAVHEASLSDYTCDICFRTFTRPYSVKVHRMIHTREALVDCEICGRTLANPGNLAVHMRIHRDEKPYACQVCPKKFRQQSSLNSHMRTHSKERPFRCEFCGKSYAFQKNLYTHRFSHTGERPYQCTFCDSAFRQIAALKVHLRAHTGEKPFKCDICFTRFTQKSHLKKHLRHIHSPKVTPKEKKEMERLRPHRCELCGKGFCSPFSVKRHINGGYCPEDPSFVPVVSKKKMMG